MTTGIRNYPRKVLSDREKTIREALARVPVSATGAPLTPSYVTLAVDATLTAERVLTAGANISLTDNGAGNTVVVAVTGLGSSVSGGVATVPFASYLTEDTIAVTGQAALTANSRIVAQVYADTDDVLAQDWYPVAVKSVVAGTGFTLSLRPNIGTFKGSVKLNWMWL